VGTGLGTPYTLYGTARQPDVYTDAYRALVTAQVRTTSGGVCHPLQSLTDSSGLWFLNLGNLKDAVTDEVYSYSTGDTVFFSILMASYYQGEDTAVVSGSSPQDCATIPSSLDNVEIHINYPADTVYLRRTNTLEIWITNDMLVTGMMLGFEFAGNGGTIVWDSAYGNSPPVNEENDAIAVWDYSGLVVNTDGFDNHLLPDSVHLYGESSGPSLGLPPNSSRLCYTLQFELTDCSFTEDFCVDNIPIWQFASERTETPDYFGCANVGPSNPTCPAVCFPVAAAEDAPTAVMAIQPDTGTAPAIVNFSDLSGNCATAWKWYFGDGDSSSLQNPSHTYTEPGDYFPVLHVSNAWGSDSIAGAVSIFAAYLCGDADGNDIVNISDAVYLIAYIFGGGPAPDPLLAGDTDCNEIVNISDAVYLIAYIFGGGPEPCEGCP
jgi:hypothetical protein